MYMAITHMVSVKGFESVIGLVETGDINSAPSTYMPFFFFSLSQFNVKTQSRQNTLT